MPGQRPAKLLPATNNTRQNREIIAKVFAPLFRVVVLLVILVVSCCDSACRYLDQQKAKNQTETNSKGTKSRAAVLLCPSFTHSLTPQSLCSPKSFRLCMDGGTPDSFLPPCRRTGFCSGVLRKFWIDLNLFSGWAQTSFRFKNIQQRVSKSVHFTNKDHLDKVPAHTNHGGVGSALCMTARRATGTLT